MKKLKIKLVMKYNIKNENNDYKIMFEDKN